MRTPDSGFGVQAWDRTLCCCRNFDTTTVGTGECEVIECQVVKRPRQRPYVLLEKKVIGSEFRQFIPGLRGEGPIDVTTHCSGRRVVGSIEIPLTSYQARKVRELMRP